MASAPEMANVRSAAGSKAKEPAWVKQYGQCSNACTTGTTGRRSASFSGTALRPSTVQICSSTEVVDGDEEAARACETEGASAANSTATKASHMYSTRFLAVLCMQHYSQ